MWPFKKKEIRWKLVKTIEAKIVWRNRDDAEDFIFYYLFESDKGTRKVEYKHTNKNGIIIDNTMPWEHPLYLSSIVPWLNGEEFDDIPSYWDKAKKENERCIQELYSRILNNG